MLLLSFLGEEEIYQSSGILIESDSVSSIVLTSADLLRSRLGGNSIANNIKVGFLYHIFNFVLLTLLTI